VPLTRDAATRQVDVTLSPLLDGDTVLGTRVTYTLSEDARVTFRVQKCARPVGKRCALWRTLKGRIVRDGKAGRNRLRLRARIGGRELAEGRYRLVARAVDPAGNKSARKRKRFRIVD